MWATMPPMAPLFPGLNDPNSVSMGRGGRKWGMEERRMEGVTVPGRTFIACGYMQLLVANSPSFHAVPDLIPAPPPTAPVSSPGLCR